MLKTNLEDPCVTFLQSHRVAYQNVTKIKIPLFPLHGF